MKIKILLVYLKCLNPVLTFLYFLCSGLCSLSVHPVSALPGRHRGFSKPTKRCNLQRVLGLAQGLLGVGHAWNASPNSFQLGGAVAWLWEFLTDLWGLMANNSSLKKKKKVLHSCAKFGVYILQLQTNSCTIKVTCPPTVGTIAKPLWPTQYYTLWNCFFTLNTHTCN